MILDALFFLYIQQVLEYVLLPLIWEELTHKCKCPNYHEVPGNQGQLENQNHGDPNIKQFIGQLIISFVVSNLLVSLANIYRIDIRVTVRNRQKTHRHSEGVLQILYDI